MKANMVSYMNEYVESRVGPNSEYGPNTELFSFLKFYEYQIIHFLKLNEY